MRKTVLALTVLLCISLITGLAVAEESDLELEDLDNQSETPEYPDLEVGEADVNHTLDRDTDGATLTVEGVYLASDAGYQITEESITVEDDQISADFQIERDEDEMAAQVITPVEFSVEEDLDPGEYDLNKSVEASNETVYDETQSVVVEESEENGEDSSDNFWDLVFSLLGLN